MANTGLNGKALSLDLSSVNTIYKDNHNDVTPYNYNVNLFIKV